MSAFDRHATISTDQQARLDGIADALTETVTRRILSDPAFVDRLVEALHFRARAPALRIREELIHLLRAYEEAHDLPRAIPAKRDVS